MTHRNRYDKSLPTFSKRLLFGLALWTGLLAAPVAAQRFLPGGLLRSTTLPAPVPSRSRSFSIPFEVRPDNSADPAKEIELMVSKDQGVRWHTAGRQSIEAKKFDFKAEEDGEFWFTFRTVTLAGVTRQAGTGPQIRVLVDSVAPKLSLEMKQQPSGEMLVQWKAEDRNLGGWNLSEKRPDFAVGSPVKTSTETSEGEKNWVPLNVDGKHFRFSETGAEGQFLFWPENDVTELELRAAIADAAGNGAEKICSATIKAVQRDEATRFQDALKAGAEKPMTPDAKVEHFVQNGAESPIPSPVPPSRAAGVRIEPPKPVRMKKGTKAPTEAAATETAATQPAEKGVPVTTSAQQETAVIPPNEPEPEPSVDPLTESLVAGMGRFFEQGLSVEIAPKVEKRSEKQAEPLPKTVPKLPEAVPLPKTAANAAPPSPSTTTDKPASPPAPSEERPSPKHPGKITGISLNTATPQPQIIVKWDLGGDPWRDAQIDIFRSVEMPETETPSPWFPIATNLANNGEYWWYLSNDDLKPFRVMIQIRAPQGGLYSDTTKSVIRINGK